MKFYFSIESAHNFKDFTYICVHHSTVQVFGIPKRSGPKIWIFIVIFAPFWGLRRQSGIKAVVIDSQKML
jgi:hypothetical protein